MPSPIFFGAMATPITGQAIGLFAFSLLSFESRNTTSIVYNQAQYVTPFGSSLEVTERCCKRSMTPPRTPQNFKFRITDFLRTGGVVAATRKQHVKNTSNIKRCNAPMNSPVRREAARQSAVSSSVQLARSSPAPWSIPHTRAANGPTARLLGVVHARDFLDQGGCRFWGVAGY
jgi:hypothetical protein